VNNFEFMRPQTSKEVEDWKNSGRKVEKIEGVFEKIF
jgi:hypothetical protein